MLLLPRNYASMINIVYELTAEEAFRHVILIMINENNLMQPIFQLKDESYYIRTCMNDNRSQNIHRH